MTEDQLKQICKTVKPGWAGILTELLPKYEINTIQRQAMFLAQCLHESAGFKYVKEIWGPNKWQLKYEGHKGLGNTQPGDGRRYMGRGLIQVTGRTNVTAFANWVGDKTIIDDPSIIEQKNNAVLSAIWFWTINKLNHYADNDDIIGCTKKVNGSHMLGLEERTRYYETGKTVLV